MKKSMITVATSAILGTLAFIKVKEKRSYKSFITEKYIRMSGMKKRLKMKRTRKKHWKKRKKLQLENMVALVMNLNMTFEQKVGMGASHIL